MVADKDFIDKAKSVLKSNDRGQFTSPAGDLYPHQWLWDSCFIAIGLRHFDVSRAQKELISLKRGQWINGMLPNMIFSSSLPYSQDAKIWRSQLSVLAPDDVNTTGITQPPMLAEAIVRVGQKLSKAERRTWYQVMYPSLLAYHQWMYDDRDPKKSGLVFLIHPYETGLDSTPPWLDQLHKHHRPWWASVIETTRLVKLVNLFRRDTRRVSPGQRISNMDALLYYDVIRKIRAKSYDSELILKKSQFAIQDLTFNSILVRANQHLESIAALLGHEIPGGLKESIAKSHSALELFWEPTAQQYYSRNYASSRLIRVPSIATLMPLYAGTISKERAKKLVHMLNREDMFKSDFPVASVPLNSKEFFELRYWQGPSWVNTNWLIIDGLERYGFKEEANQLRQQTLAMVREHGFYEYFSPIDGSPAGASDFSWSAALALDLVSR